MRREGQKEEEEGMHVSGGQGKVKCRKECRRVGGGQA